MRKRNVRAVIAAALCMNFFAFKTFVTLSTRSVDSFDTLYDIFKCGFMSGYLQSKAQK